MTTAREPPPLSSPLGSSASTCPASFAGGEGALLSFFLSLSVKPVLNTPPPLIFLSKVGGPREREDGDGGDFNEGKFTTIAIGANVQ